MSVNRTVGSRSRHPVQAIPRSRFRVLRLAWVLITLLVLALFITGISLAYNHFSSSIDERALEGLDLSINGLFTYLVVLNLVVLLAHIMIATIIFWRQPQEWMALFVAIALVANGGLLPLSFLYEPVAMPPGWTLSANLVFYTGLTSGAAILYLFPTGHFVPSWTRLLVLGWGVLAFFTVFIGTSSLSLTSWSLPLQVLAVLLASGAGIFAQIHRYERVSSPIQRQQTKWALVGLMAAVVGPAFWLFGTGATTTSPEVPNLLYQRVGASFFSFSLVFSLLVSTAFHLTTILFPLSFTVAILRHRLWEIDLIIHRTLVYSVLTGALLLVYFGSVITLHSLFTIVGGQQSSVAIVLSTLAIAALFNPLRRRVQDFIDRRFYRRKYDAEQALLAFTAAARDEVDMERLSEALLAVVEETMQPTHASLWIKQRADW